MEEKKLYPFRFAPLEDKYSWGTEEFLLADLGYRDSFITDGWLADNSLSELMDMYMDRVVGESSFSFYGRQFPFQVKRIKVSGGRMPLRVHPDDELSGPRYDLLGKEKIWYVRKAAPDGGIWCGFNSDINAEQLVSRISDGSVGEVMNTLKVSEGDYITIHPGTVHGAYGHLEIIEISESSPLDFKVYDWGNCNTDEFEEAFDVTEALDFINYSRYDNAGDNNVKHFTARTILLGTPLKVRSAKEDSCVCYLTVKGKACIQTELGVTLNYNFSEGENLLVPSDVEEFSLLPLAEGTEVIEILPSRIIEKDSYTGE